MSARLAKDPGVVPVGTVAGSWAPWEGRVQAASGLGVIKAGLPAQQGLSMASSHVRRAGHRSASDHVPSAGTSRIRFDGCFSVPGPGPGRPAWSVDSSHWENLEFEV